MVSALSSPSYLISTRFLSHPPRAREREALSKEESGHDEAIKIQVRLWKPMRMIMIREMRDRSLFKSLIQNHLGTSFPSNMKRNQVIIQTVEQIVELRIVSSTMKALMQR
jgi:hypothetical protein